MPDPLKPPDASLHEPYATRKGQNARCTVPNPDGTLCGHTAMEHWAPAGPLPLGHFWHRIDDRNETPDRNVLAPCTFRLLNGMLCGYEQEFHRGSAFNHVWIHDSHEWAAHVDFRQGTVYHDPKTGRTEFRPWPQHLDDRRHGYVVEPEKFIERAEPGVYFLKFPDGYDFASAADDYKLLSRLGDINGISFIPLPHGLGVEKATTADFDEAVHAVLKRVDAERFENLANIAADIAEGQR